MLYSLQKEGANMKNQFYANIELVESAIQDAGYIPYDQLYGFLLTGNSAYITRKDNARSIAENLDRDLLRQYLSARKGF